MKLFSVFSLDCCSKIKRSSRVDFSFSKAVLSFSKFSLESNFPINKPISAKTMAIKKYVIISVIMSI